MHTLLYGEALLTKLFTGNIAAPRRIGIFRGSFMASSALGSFSTAALNSAISGKPLEEFLDPKEMLLGSLSAGVSGGLGSALGSVKSLGELGQGAIMSGINFGLDASKAGLMALNGDGEFDAAAFGADVLGSLASNGFSLMGEVASYGVKSQLNDYSNDKILATRRGDAARGLTDSLEQTGLRDGLVRDDQLLPTGTTYKEYDVNPKFIDGQKTGKRRDEERLVVGADRSVWYTTDHYHTFIRIK